MNWRDKYERTVCDCRLCVAGCKSMPGALVPSDLPRIMRHTGLDPESFLDWCESHFDVSDGGVAMKLVDGEPVVFQVPSIVPQLVDGRCVFLDSEDHCTIHAVSPAGCAYCDPHQDRETTDGLLSDIIVEQMTGLVFNPAWSILMSYLDDRGHNAPPIFERKAAYVAELEKCSEVSVF